MFVMINLHETIKTKIEKAVENRYRKMRFITSRKNENIIIMQSWESYV